MIPRALSLGVTAALALSPVSAGAQHFQGLDGRIISALTPRAQRNTARAQSSWSRPRRDRHARLSTYPWGC